jgi:hypothetical protein
MDRDKTTSMTYADLQKGARPSGEIRVEGGGVVRGVDLSNWNAARLLFAEAPSLLREVLPRPLKPGRVGRDIPLFIECDFSGLTCPAFDPGIARFLRCRFENVSLKLNLGAVRAHFEDCVFSGRWEGNFDARPDLRDPAKRVLVRGNDFTGCREMGLQGGIDRTANRLDPSLHLILWRGDPNWKRIRELAEEDTYLRSVASSVEGRGPLDLGQDWTLLHRELITDELWARLRQAGRS